MYFTVGEMRVKGRGEERRTKGRRRRECIADGTKMSMSMSKMRNEEEDKDNENENENVVVVTRSVLLWNDDDFFPFVSV